jgi:hypothetical protein
MPKGGRKPREKLRSGMRPTDGKVGGSENRSPGKKVSARVCSNGRRKKKLRESTLGGSRLCL